MARTRGMETQPVIAKQERIDDVPLLLGMMQRMKIAETLDRHLGLACPRFMYQAV